MNYNMYSIFDRMAQVFSEPFLAQNNAIAQRRFQYVAKNSPMVSEDLQLFKVGSFDTITADIVPCKEFVCNFIKDGE